MGRKARELRPGVAMHIWQRGNHQERVFLTELDYQVFLKVLRDRAGFYEMQVFGFCLMSNHYHLIAACENEKAIPLAIGRLNREYSFYRHDVMKTKGQLWQGRFGSCLLDDAHFWAALCYVERNPMEAGMVCDPWDWPWSSARAHIGLARYEWLDDRRWAESYDFASWRRALDIGIADEALEERIEEGKSDTGKIWYHGTVEKVWKRG
jgi:putative transposase